MAVLIETGEIVFRGREVLSSGSLIVLEGKGIVARDKLSVFVEIAEIEFGEGIILGGGSAQELNRRLGFGRGRVVGEQVFGKAILGIGIAALSEGSKIGN